MEFTETCEELKQIARSFDRVTIQKIIIGSLHAGVVALALYGLDQIVAVLNIAHFSNPLLASIYAWVVQSGYNAIRQWLKGEPKE